MNYAIIRYALIDSLDLNECCIRKAKLIRKLGLKLCIKPMNLAESTTARNNHDHRIKLTEARRA